MLDNICTAETWMLQDLKGTVHRVLVTFLDGSDNTLAPVFDTAVTEYGRRVTMIPNGQFVTEDGVILQFPEI